MQQLFATLFWITVVTGIVSFVVSISFCPYFTSSLWGTPQRVGADPKFGFGGVRLDAGLEAQQNYWAKVLAGAILFGVFAGLWYMGSTRAF